MWSCPDWSDDIPANRASEFDECLTLVYRNVLAVARRMIISHEQPSLWHRALFSNFVPVVYYAGNYRQNDSTRICLKQDVHVGGIPGCDYQRVLQRVVDLFEKLRISVAQTELIWGNLSRPERAKRLALMLAAFIGEFIRIHPFINGNGRISRLLWAWGLMRFGIPVQCRVSPRPGPPYPDLMAEAMKGNDIPLAFSIAQHLASYNPNLD